MSDFFDDEEHRVLRELPDPKKKSAPDSEKNPPEKAEDSEQGVSSAENLDGQGTASKETGNPGVREGSLPSDSSHSADSLSGNSEAAANTAGTENSPSSTSQEAPSAESEHNAPDAGSSETNSNSSAASSPDAQPAGSEKETPPAVQHANHVSVTEKSSTSSSDSEEEEEERPMTLLEHLGELRRRLTRVVIVVLLGFVACYGVAEPLYSFIAAPLTAVLPEGSKLIYTAPQGAFFTYLKVSLMAAVFLSSPYSFYQIWAFIAPGLYNEEKQAVVPLAVLSAFFFLSGATFCYYLVFPLAFQFFMGFTTDTIVPMISVEEYLSFALKLLLAFGFVFEMPLFAFFLSKLGILTPETMRKHRKYAILAIFIVAAILTPPDVFSQCLMAGPMCLLYELSIYVAIWARKKKEEKKTPTAEA